MLIKPEKSNELKTIESFEINTEVHKKILKYCKDDKLDMSTFFRGAANHVLEQEDALKKKTLN